MAGLESVEDARTTVVQVAAGEAHSVALTAAGSVYSWGRGLFGRLGVGVFQDELIPTYVAIEMTLDDDDSSMNSQNALSVSSREDSNRMICPRSRDGVHRSKAIQVAAGAYHSLALAADGSVWSWGYNAYGQLGREKAASQPSPVIFSFKTPAEEVRGSGALWVRGSKDVELKHPKIILVEAGGMISCAIDVDGGLWLWGAAPSPSESSDHFQGKSSFSISNIEKPERVRGLSGLRVYRVACGNEHILALVEGRDDTDSDCYAWGGNAFGQLGLGDVKSRAYPQLVKSLAASVIGTVVDLACGAFHSAVLAVKDDQPTDLVLEPISPKVKRNRAGPDIMPDSFSPIHHRSRSLIADQYLDSSRNTSLNVQTRQDSDTSSSIKSTAWGSSRQSSNHSLGHHKDLRLGVEGRVSLCWTFGQGEYGQLGHGNASNQAYPAPVEGLPDHERLRTIACGLFHTAVVTETGDVWVWGMEGGLGLCPGIGPPDARSGNALTPVRVFGESSAKCHPVTGSKGITCGAAHTVTLSNGGRDIWAWGRGQSGVLGLGHTSDSWFPCPVVWPPVALAPWSSSEPKELNYQVGSLYPMGFNCRRPSRASSKTGSKDSGDCSRPSKDKATEQTVDELTTASEDANALKMELAGVRRYVESLHAAIYGEVEVFTQPQSRELSYADGSSSDCGSSDQGRGSSGLMQQKKSVQEWEHRIETASDADLVRLDQFYRSMRSRLKDLLFQRKMDDWCRRCMTVLSISSASTEPPPMQEPYSSSSSIMPTVEGLGELAIRKSGILGDRVEMLPPPALAASFDHFRMRLR